MRLVRETCWQIERLETDCYNQVASKDTGLTTTGHMHDCYTTFRPSIPRNSASHPTNNTSALLPHFPTAIAESSASQSSRNLVTHYGDHNTLSSQRPIHHFPSKLQDVGLRRGVHENGTRRKRCSRDHDKIISL